MEKTVQIYSTPTCHFCHMAKDFFTEHNVPFTDVDVSVDKEKLREMVEMTGQMGVPVIRIGDIVAIGFNKAKIAEVLGISL